MLRRIHQQQSTLSVQKISSNFSCEVFSSSSSSNTLILSSSSSSPAATASAVAVTSLRTWFKPGLAEGPLDKQVADTVRKGPPVAHSIPHYKKAHKLIGSQRWKTSNLVTNVVSGKDYRLRDSHGEGRVDETGQYRDWLYGEERRFANYLGLTLFGISASLFYYTIKMMGGESWDIPTPLLVKPPPMAGSKEFADANALLASPPRK
jgi:hypothetical protein